MRFAGFVLAGGESRRMGQLGEIVGPLQNSV
jgi:hypothetical protein